MRRLQRNSLACSCPPFAVAALCLSTSVAFAGPGDELKAPTPTAPVYGGEATGTCAWPTTVEVDGCTGTLVHPGLVITAAHCVFSPGGSTPINFGESWNSPARTVTGSCQAHPEYNNGNSSGRDIAYCTLSAAVNDVPIVPILMGCGTQALQANQEVAVVGFGLADDNLGDGPKRQVFTTLNSVADDEAFVGGNGKDSCQGDSGGPVYIPMADGSWRVFGITSYGGQCGGGGYYSLMHVGVPWIEMSSGVDITPCHDANGDWNPGEGCDNAPTQPQVGGGDWSNGCAGGNAIAVTEICEGGSVDTVPGDGDGDGDGDGGSGEAGTDSATTDSGSGEAGEGTDTGSADGEVGTDEVGTGTSDDAGVDEAGDDKGCGCNSRQDGTPLGALAMLGLLGLLRRGRRGRRHCINS